MATYHRLEFVYTIDGNISYVSNGFKWLSKAAIGYGCVMID